MSAVLCGALRSCVVVCLEHSRNFALVQPLGKKQVRLPIVIMLFLQIIMCKLDIQIVP